MVRNSTLTAAMVETNRQRGPSPAMVKEKEAGTIAQLLMTPADGAEVIVARIVPIVLLLSLDIGLSVGIGHLVFDLPVRGLMGLSTWRFRKQLN